MKIFFEDLNVFQLQIKVHQGYRPPFHKPINQSYRNLIEKCWSQIPENRPSFDETLEQLKIDRGFITEDVNEEDYLNYIKYIDEYKKTFDAADKIESIDKFFVKHKLKKFHAFKFDQQLNQIFLNDLSSNFSFFKLEDYIKLNEDCKKIVKDAECNYENQFKLGQYLIEGQYHFPINVQLGIKYLKNSFKNGCIDALIYYCKMFIKGYIVPKKP